MNLRVFYLTRRGISDGYRRANVALFCCPNAALFRRAVPLFILLSQVAAVCTFGMSII